MKRWCLFVLAVWVSLVARAQPENASQLEGIVKEAEALYRVQEYEEALSKFKQAYTLSLDPAILFNIAQCHRLLKRHQEALLAYRTFLREAPASALAASATARIKELESLLSDENRATLILSSKAPSAQVSLDGVLRGSTPLELRVLPGGYTLRVEKEGFYPFEQRVSLEPSQRLTLDVPLYKEPPSYVLPLSLGGAGVIAGGVFLGLLQRARQDDVNEPNEGVVLRAAALTSDALLLSSGASALFIWRQRHKVKQIQSQERPR